MEACVGDVQNLMTRWSKENFWKDVAEKHEYGE